MIEHRIKINEAFRFEAGGELPELELSYFTSDREYREGDKVIWICHALTGNANPEDWWSQLVGKGCLVDTEKYFVVCSAMICSPYGACSPATVNPATGKPFMMDFPETTVRDIVNANILVRKHLGIDVIDVMIGPSIGGFQAIEWCIIEPDVIKKAAFIATDYRVTPFMTALNESQRMAIDADPTFRAMESLAGGRAGLACARSIALVSYRTFEGYNYTQEETNGDTLFAQRACSYQQYQGKKLVDRFDAYSYWYLTRTLDSHNVGRGRGGCEKALGTIKADCTVVCINSDMLFHPEYNKFLASCIPGARYVELTSIFGHDGFLIENDQLVKALEPIFENN